MRRPTKSMKVLSLSYLSITPVFIYLFSFNDPIISIHHPILIDLAKDNKIFDVNEVINLDTSKLQVEATGAWIIQQIQEWLLTKVSSSEVATLPEDMTQCMLVRVCSHLSFITFEIYFSQTFHNHFLTSHNLIYNLSFVFRLATN